MWTWQDSRMNCLVVVFIIGKWAQIPLTLCHHTGFDSLELFAGNFVPGKAMESDSRISDHPPAHQYRIQKRASQRSLRQSEMPVNLNRRLQRCDMWCVKQPERLTVSGVILPD